MKARNSRYQSYLLELDRAAFVATATDDKGTVTPLDADRLWIVERNLQQSGYMLIMYERLENGKCYKYYQKDIDNKPIQLTMDFIL